VTDADDYGARALAEGPLFAAARPEDVGAFAGSKVTPTVLERTVGEVIWQHRGRANAIKIRVLAKMFGRDERTIKGIVEQLVVTHRMRIGGVREGDTAGYFVIEDAADLAAAVGPYRSQIFAMFRRLRVLLAPHELRELLGQLVIEEKVGE